jgi:hypothetical protein
MGLLDGPLKGVVASVVKTLGTTITLVEVQTGLFVPSQDKSVLSKVNHIVTAVVAENKSTSHEGDYKFSVPAADIAGLVPTADWYLVWDERRYNINEVAYIYASAEPVLYDIYASTPT